MKAATATFRYDAFGVAIEFTAAPGAEAGPADIAGRMVGWRPVDAVDAGAPEPARRYHLAPQEWDGYYDVTISDRVVEWLNAGEAARAIEGDCDLYIAEHAPDRVFIHAGVVALAGGAVLLPGESMAGKSTLTAALLRAGATYYSDEWAVITADGLIEAYPRRLAMRDPERGRLQIPAAEFGAATGTRLVPLRAVIVTSYENGRRWDPVEVPRGIGFRALLNNAVAARTYTARVIQAIAAALRSPGVVVLEGLRGEADETAARIIARFG